MPGFRTNSGSNPGWIAWEGDPNDAAAHQAVLAWLQPAVTSGFLQAPSSAWNSIKGNLGEFIAYCIGKNYVFADVAVAHAANASDPLSPISRPDIDIVWLHFGEIESEDWAVLQEVKTTGEASLRLANDLLDDYDKLFGENLRLTLHTRLNALKNRLDQQGSSHLCTRVSALAGPSPQQSPAIRLVPTLLHDAAHPSSEKMDVVRQGLIGRHWASHAVVCWSIAFSNIDQRLNRLSRGQP